MKLGLKVLVAALLAVLTAAGTASAAPDRTIDVGVGKTETWSGADAPGANITYWGVPLTGAGATYACGKQAQDYCEYVLFKFTNPVPEDDADGRLTRSASITVDANNDVSDFDLLVYASDAQGTKGEEVGRSTFFAYESTTETAAVSVTTTRAKPTVYVLAEVVYFSAAQGYAGTVRF